MDLQTAFSTFLDRLRELPNVTLFAPSAYVTAQSAMLPAILADISAPEYTAIDESKTLAVTGKLVEMEFDVPLDKTNLAALDEQVMALINQVVPIVNEVFEPFRVTIGAPWSAVVPFGAGEAYGSGFSLTISLA